MSPASALTVHFCGEDHAVDPERGFTIGREADLAVDDNQFLHRRFLSLEHRDGLWWLANVGGQLAATVSDPAGRLQAWLAPGARLPLVLPAIEVRFTAGPTSYELALSLADAAFDPVPQERADDGATTIGRTTLTPDQKRLVVALSEPVLLQTSRAPTDLPSSAQAAARLGWSSTKFNRKLDNVCQKLERIGVRGLHGGPGSLASNRRARLVEYAVSSRLVTVDDLPLLDIVEGPGVDDEG